MKISQAVVESIQLFLPIPAVTGSTLHISFRSLDTPEAADLGFLDAGHCRPYRFDDDERVDDQVVSGIQKRPQAFIGYFPC